MADILKQVVALVTAFQGVLGVIAGAGVTYLATKFTERRSDVRQTIQLAAADKARRYEIGREDALKAIRDIDRLLGSLVDPDNPDDPSSVAGVLILDDQRAAKLANRVERLPEEATARRGLWLVRVATAPRTWSPMPQRNLKFQQTQALAYLRDDMARFARGSDQVSDEAAALSKSIEDHYWASMKLLRNS